VQVDASIVVSLFGIFLTAGLGLYLAMKKSGEDERSKRWSGLEADIKAHDERLRLDELATTKLIGELALLEQAQTGLQESLRKIEDGMVPRAEWEQRMGHVEDQLGRIIVKLDSRSGGGSGRYGTVFDPRLQQGPPPSPLPPRPPKGI
jgi:hypothetical protein